MSKKATNKNKPKTNRLIKEKSPYLLQHATNPVDWYPWGEEAFEKAKKEDKPIFLSIGYSTCHWCHVMAHESFEDPEVAKLMNETFVNIKVDREERPEIDNIYMTVSQMITGSGGWPLTIIMDADKKPFTAGTYFPKESRFGRIGMLEFIPKIKDYWDNNREELRLAAKEVISQLQSLDTTPGEELKQEILNEAFREATLLFDEKNGGFRGAPKFPTPHKLMFLLRFWKRTGNKAALMMVEKTLTEMRLGGIYDHIGFGFHRYSTDSFWLLPHFEKMLYDQALLVIAYVEAYQATKKIEFREVAEEILSYVLRDMTSPEGGFYSAEDAD
ncbi:MAG: thioredoxin domain-containing protein, partial [Candidatus Heimdallarchaeota archaeon]|nr:thioredoxin domain-containing protein [Candidatus Heimdallarchaeota archaeon]